MVNGDEDDLDSLPGLEPVDSSECGDDGNEEEEEEEEEETEEVELCKCTVLMKRIDEYSLDRILSVSHQGLDLTNLCFLRPYP